MESTGSSKPLVVYTIVERERDGKKFWVRIGAAFRNRDGSLNAYLDAVPTNGTIHIREYRPYTQPGGHDPAGDDAHGDLEIADVLAG